MALQQELRDAYLKGVETGRRLERAEKHQGNIAYEIMNGGGNIKDASDSSFHRKTA